LTPCYDCLDWINPTISPRSGMRCAASYEKIVLPSNITSRTPVPPKLIFGVTFN